MYKYYPRLKVKCESKYLAYSWKVDYNQIPNNTSKQGLTIMSRIILYVKCVFYTIMGLKQHKLRKMIKVHMTPHDSRKWIINEEDYNANYVSESVNPLICYRVICREMLLVKWCLSAKKNLSIINELSSNF